MTIMINGAEYVTLATAARLLGLSPKTITNRQAAGRLDVPVVHIGREPLYLRSALPAEE